MANANRGKKSKRFKVADFVPDWDPKPQTWQEQLSIVEQLNEAFGGEDLRERNQQSPRPDRG